MSGKPGTPRKKLRRSYVLLPARVRGEKKKLLVRFKVIARDLSQQEAEALTEEWKTDGYWARRVLPSRNGKNPTGFNTWLVAVRRPIT